MNQGTSVSWFSYTDGPQQTASLGLLHIMPTAWDSNVILTHKRISAVCIPKPCSIPTQKFKKKSCGRSRLFKVHKF